MKQDSLVRRFLHGKTCFSYKKSCFHYRGNRIISLHAAFSTLYVHQNLWTPFKHCCFLAVKALDSPFYGSLVLETMLETSRAPKGGRGKFSARWRFMFFNFIFNYKKKLKVERKEFRRGIEPGSSGWKARLITIRPRDGLLEIDGFFLYLNHLNFSRMY